MSHHQPQAPGFVLPPTANQQPSYPAYPSSQHHGHQPAYNHQPFPGPIQQQPAHQQQPMNWFYNTDFTNYLRNASMFHVKQKVELLEAIVGWETPNKYTIKDQFGNKVFYAGEETQCLSRNILGKCRPFTVVIKDIRGMDVLRIDRGLDCACCCALFCADSLTVSTANGQKLGSVCEKFNIFSPVFSIKDAGGNTRLKIEGPMCPLTVCGGSVVFKLLTPDGVTIGAVSKEYGGLVRELFTDADQFNITFPPDLEPSIKAVCLGALFLIDYQYFEASGGRTREQGGRRLFG